jgi:hypothetical protein
VKVSGPENVRFAVIVDGRLRITAPIVGDAEICPAVPVTLLTAVPAPEHEPHTAIPPTPIKHMPLMIGCGTPDPIAKIEPLTSACSGRGIAAP